MEKALPFLLALLTILPACSSPIGVSETISQDSRGANGEPGGLVYALPTTTITVKADQNSNGVVSYTITTSIVADPAARFRIRYNPSTFTQDVLDLQVSAEGLLTNDANADVRDQTSAIVARIARTAGALAAQGGTVRLDAERTQEAPPRGRQSVYPFEQSFFANDLLATTQARFYTLADGTQLSLRDGSSVGETARGVIPSIQCDFLLCFRIPRPMIISIHEDRQGQRTRPIVERVIAVMDPRHIEGIDLRSASLATRNDILTFQNGSPTRLRITRGSSALAFVSLPLDAMTAFFSGITEGFTSRSNAITAQTTLINAQRDLLIAEAQRIQREIELTNAQRQRDEAAARPRPEP